MRTQPSNPDASAGPSGLRAIGRALRSRNYRLFFVGQGVSMIGTWMQRVALLWLVGGLYPDEKVAAFWLGVVAFAGQIPSFVLTPLAGVLADRWNRHRTVILTQSLAMAQAFLLAALTLTGLVQLWHIIVLSVWLGVVHALDVPMRQAFVVEMVDRPEDLNNAIALNSTIVNTGRLLGPAIGGVLTAVAGPGVCFVINGVSFLAVLAALLAMRIRPRDSQPAHRDLLAGLKEGFRYAFSFPPIRGVLLLMALVSVAGMSYAALLPVFAKHVLGGSSRTLGYLMAGIGIGALAGAIHLASRATVRGLERLIAIAPSLLGVALIAFSLSRAFWLSLLLMPALGFGQMLLIASCNTILQTIVDDDKRGRVMSFYATAFMGMAPVGSLLIGSAASQIGAPWAVAVGGSVCIVGSMAFALRLPVLRRLVHPIYVRKGIIPPPLAEGIGQAADLTSPPRT